MAELYISDSTGKLVTSFDYPASISRCSYARTTDGGNTWRWTGTPTQGKTNVTSSFADKLFVTPKYLSEVCKSVSGKTANYWITRFTIIHIRRLLQQREKSFTEIAYMFDFSSPAYFSRFVQKHLGKTPTNFRE